ncbi:HAD domain-containing protein [Cytophagaceae bacterium DM2B3-1]|uniref:HAD domain-containing protein n=1 Tax=Xanthocytophaga flava TaxID=3048013 RepID=A0ABT7CQA2_9BACT|nr:HAD domain-containing protein [Xanthocytophaga flavus]MDJ1468028.1 HAD domain-containing protein [Xanthocytophaga flavus]MDJ1495923.1 HAD domain-containing protein [Xanthocytophaga flavus]
MISKPENTYVRPWHILLDIDGVFITTPIWKPDVLHEDGYSDFRQDCVKNFNELVQQIDARIIITSSRRHTKNRDELALIFQNREIHTPIEALLPIYENVNNRKEELTLFILQNWYEKYIIIDDDMSLHELEPDIKQNCIITTYSRGFDREALATTQLLISG